MNPLQKAPFSQTFSHRKFLNPEKNQLALCSISTLRRFDVNHPFGSGLIYLLKD